MATSLISGDCGHLSDANYMFATNKGLLVLRPKARCCSMYFAVPSGCYALVTSHGADLDYNPSKVATTTPGKDGVTATTSTRGKTAVWPSGLHFPYPPWVRVSHLVTKQSIVLDLPVKACRTRDNVTVTIDVALSFRIMGDEALGEDPELVRKFVYQVKPRGLEQQLRDAQEEAVRGLARSMKHTEIYGIRSGKEVAGSKTAGSIVRGAIAAASPRSPRKGLEGVEEEKEEIGGGDDDDGDSEDELSSSDDEEEDYRRDEILEGSSDIKDRVMARRSMLMGQDVTMVMRDELNKQFMPQGVQIQSVMIKSVSLPEDITTQMSEKTMIISANAQQIMFHQNEMQTTRQEQEVETMLQTFQERCREEENVGAERIGAERVKLNDAEADAEKAEANIREETAVKIESLLAESALEVQRIRDKTHADVVEIATAARKESSELSANTKLEVQTLISESELQAARNLAQAKQVIDQAEGKVAPWLEKKKEFLTKVRELEVYEHLATNEELVVTGAGDDADGDDGMNLIAISDAILQSGSEGASTDRSALLAELALMSKGSSAFLAPPHGKEQSPRDVSQLNDVMLNGTT